MEEGDEVLRRAERLLASMGEATSTPVREFKANPLVRSGRGAVRELERGYYGSDGALMDSELADGFRVTGEYQVMEMPPTASVQELVNRTERMVRMDPSLQLFEHSDDHVRFARCLVVKDENSPPYCNASTLEEYYNLLSQVTVDESNMARQTLDAKRRVEENARRRKLEERETWKLMLMLHSGLVEPFNAEPRCPQSAIKFEYHAAKNRQLQLWHVVTRWFHLTAQERAKRAEGDDDVDEGGFSSSSTRQQADGAYLPCTVKAAQEHRIQRHPRQGSENRENEFNRLDPDATLHGVSLELDDQDDQVALLEQLWQLVVQGAFYVEVDETEQKQQDELSERVHRLCSEYGEPWRAASLSGGRPYRPKFTAPGPAAEWQGNAYRAVWNEMCLRASEKLAKDATTYEVHAQDRQRARAARLESAIYAAMCGDVKLLEGSGLLRDDWRLHCWARFRSMVQARFDLICLENFRILENRWGHTPGPAAESGCTNYSASLHLRANESLESANQSSVFARAEESVSQEELRFFRIQRALIEGRFSDHLSAPDSALGGINESGDDEIESGADLCTFLCGPNWHMLGMLTVAQVCGFDFIEGEDGQHQIGKRLDDDARAEAALERAPCWKVENRTIVTQLLRFAAHATVYMSNASTQSSVVQEQRSREAIKPESEAIVLAYVRFLLTDKHFMLDRYALIPVFYPSFESENLALAVQAAMIEAVAVTDIDAWKNLLDRWEETVKPQCLLHQAARQAVRNVRRQWLHDEEPEEVVRVALDELRAQRNVGSGGEEGSEQQSEDVRLRLIETWRWLAVNPSTRTEAIVQANQILRDLAMQGFQQSATDALQVALNFVRTHINDLCERQDPPVPEWRMSGQSLSMAMRELECWRLFLDANETVMIWRRSMEWLSQQSTPPKSLADDMFTAAVRVAQAVEKAFTFPRGWLLFEDEEQAGQDQLAMETAAAFEQDPITPQEEKYRQKLLGKRGSPGELRSQCVLYLTHEYVDILQTCAEEIAARSKGESRRVAELYHKAMRVSDLVANDEADLLQCFEPSAMARLLQKIKLIAVELLRLEGSIF